MKAFAAGELQMLVSTTVVEVGVDVPNASVMIVEHAERFGLSQLHQLRGRVGRDRHQSYCFLLYQSPLSDEARERLKAMTDTTDGFEIAERDLRLRGPGDGGSDHNQANLGHRQQFIERANDPRIRIRLCCLRAVTLHDRGQPQTRHRTDYGCMKCAPG